MPNEENEQYVELGFWCRRCEESFWRRVALRYGVPEKPVCYVCGKTDAVEVLISADDETVEQRLLNTMEKLEKRMECIQVTLDATQGI
jgi:hypothetical protein